MTFRLGPLLIDPVGYGSQGSAVLGIRDSGKSYTATFLAERLFEAGIPFIAFDPIGVWRFLKVPGKGRGYPVVVAGGKEPDLALTPATAPAVVEAAMQNGISLVIDLFSIELSKADWRKIVCDSVRLLLHRNQPHGLRHVFIEEAAEFIPQKPTDWNVYAEIEKLARMGGNSRLGYTLINQRSQEVSKAILELCENVFLHRQRGKNALENMDKWLSIAGAADQKEIVRSLPDLPQGECWAWLGGDKPTPPTRIRVPEKNSLHPDRRVMRGDDLAVAKAAVDVGSFVATLREALPALEQESRANDPKALKAEIAALKKQLAEAGKASPAPDPQELERARQEGYREAYDSGIRALSDLAVDFVTSTMRIQEQLQELHDRAHEVHNLTEGRAEKAVNLLDIRAPIYPTDNPPPFAPPRTVPAPAPSAVPESPPGAKPVAHIANGSVPTFTGPQQRILASLAFWKGIGHLAPSRSQVAFVANYSPKSSGFEKALSNTRTAGLIEYPSGGRLALTPLGAAQAQQLSLADARQAIRSVLSRPQVKITDSLLAAERALTRAELADLADYSNKSSGFEKVLSQLKTLNVVHYPGAGEVALTEWAAELLV